MDLVSSRFRSRVVSDTEDEDDDVEEEENVREVGENEEEEEEEEEDEDEDIERYYEEDLAAAEEGDSEDEYEEDDSTCQDALEGDEAPACVYVRYHDPTKQKFTAGYACVGDKTAAVFIPYEPTIDELAVAAISEELR
eukprot:jgi/Mesen1/8187/ME000044S07458